MQHQTDVIAIFSICKFCVILFHQRPQGCAHLTFPCSLLSFVFVANKNKILISAYPDKQKKKISTCCPQEEFHGNTSPVSVLWLGKRRVGHVIKGVNTSPVTKHSLVTAGGPGLVSLDIPEPRWQSPRMFSQLMLESNLEFQGSTSD